MPYFPLFIDLTDRPCLIVGGGRVACRKAEKLLPYKPKLTIVAPHVCPELEAIPGITILRRPYTAADVNGMSLVIAAAGEQAVNRAVSRDCRTRNIPVNVVDDKDSCTFLFPCLVRQGELSVGISTGGASPTAAIWVKNQIEDLLPSRFDEILLWLEALRPRLKFELPDENRRAALFSALFHACLEKGRALTEDELTVLMEATL